jgi:signal transduction histidine kinase
MSDTILIRVGGTTGAMNKTSKVIAGLAYNLPQEMIFVFRIMLTALVIVFTSGVLMSLSKKRYNN